MKKTMKKTTKVSRDMLLQKIISAAANKRTTDIASELSERESRKVTSAHVCHALAGDRDYLLVPLANLLLSGTWEKETVYTKQ